MDSGYPKLIADDFPGVGNKVDGVFQNKGKSIDIFSPFVTIPKVTILLFNVNIKKQMKIKIQM